MATTGGQSFWLNDRRVIVRTGIRSQTVNVCTRQNAPGEYEAVYRLPILSAIAALDVPEMANLHAFGTWLIHKEWPETLPGRDVDRRGLFDLAVLAPSQLAQASIDQFRQGRIHAPIVGKWASITGVRTSSKPSRSSATARCPTRTWCTSRGYQRAARLKAS